MSQATGGTSAQIDASLRAKIVGILSDTANGCLTELGYFPGLLKRVQELEQTNAQWKEENVRLFRDNQALTEVTRYHQDRLKQINAAPDNSGRVASLEEQVKSLSIQNAELRKKNDALTASGSSHVPYQQLVVDYQQLATLYRTATSEIQHLRRQVMQMNATPPSGRPHMVPSQTDLVRAPEPRPPQEHHVPSTQKSPFSYISDQVLHNPAMPPRRQIPVSVPAVYQPPHMITQPIASIYHDQQEMTSSRSTRPPSGVPIAAQGPPQQVIEPPHTMAPLNITPYSYRPPLNIKTSLSANPGDRPSPSGHPNDAQFALFGSPHTPSGRVSYASPTRRNTQPGSRPVSWPPTRPPSQAATNPLSPAVKNASASNTPRVDFAPYKSMSPSESVEVATPPAGLLDTLPIEVASSPVLGLEQLKRPRENISGDATEDLGSANKKARLNEDSHVFGEVTAEKEIDDADDDSEQEIEVDKDGLRSAASCISELIETSLEDPNVQICRLCEVRHKNGMISEMPNLRASPQDDLVRHMTTEHTDVWEELRHDV